MKSREILTKSLAAFEAAGVFCTPLARLSMGNRWSEYHDDAVTRRAEVMDLLRQELRLLPADPGCCGTAASTPEATPPRGRPPKMGPTPSEYPYRDIYTDAQWRKFSTQKRGAITKELQRRYGLCVICVKNPALRREREEAIETGWRPQILPAAKVNYRCACGQLFGCE